MRIAILGAGNAGCTVAGDLTKKGHEVTLIKTSDSLHNDNFNYLVEHNGEFTILEGDEKTTVNIAKVTHDLAELSKNELVIIYIQTKYHEDLIKKASKYFIEGQMILINPGYLSTAYVKKYAKNVDLTIIEATSSFIDCRIMEPGVSKVGFRNVRNPIGVYPNSRTEDTLKKLEPLGYNLHAWNTVEVALHNPNLIVHTIGAIFSIPRIEKTNGDYCMYWEAFTPTVWKCLEQLDSEKMDVLEHLGLKRIAYVDACKFRNTLDTEVDGKEIFFWYAGMPTRAKGPTTVNHRYITEDVPEGLVMLETLGKHLNIATPICTALIEIASAALGVDFRKEGRSIERLGEESVQTILADCKRA